MGVEFLAMRKNERCAGGPIGLCCSSILYENSCQKSGFANCLLRIHGRAMAIEHFQASVKGVAVALVAFAGPVSHQEIGRLFD